MARHDAGADGGAFQPRRKGAGFEAGDVGAGQHLAVGEPGLASNRARGFRVVAGDHQHAHAGPAALRHRFRNAGAKGIGKADQAEQVKGHGGRIVRPGRGRVVRHRHGQYPQAFARHRGGCLQGRRALAGAAQPDDGFRRSLGRRHRTAVAVPGADDGRPAGGQSVLAAGLAAPRRGLRLPRSRLGQRQLDRVQRLRAAGQHGHIQHLAQAVGQGRAVGRIAARAGAPHPAQCHPVFGQGAGLVDAQHRGRAEDFDRGKAPRQHMAAREPPGADGRKDRQDDGELLGQHGHRQRHPGQQGLQPVAATQAQQQHQQQAHADPAHRQAPRQAACFLLQAAGRRRDPAKRGADTPQFGMQAGGPHPRHPVALYHQGAGEDPWQVVAARGARHAVGRAMRLADGNRLAGQQRFVGQHAAGFEQQGVGGYPVAFREKQEVAADQRARGDAQLPAVAHDGGGGGAEIAQRLQRALGAAFLVQGHAEHEQDHAGQEYALARLAKQQIHQRGAQQQHEHRFARGAGQDRGPAVAAGLGQGIRAVRGKAACRFRRRQARMGCNGVQLAHGAPCSMVRMPQWASSRGTGARCSSSRVAPPSTHSR